MERVLVIDDDTQMRYLVTQILEREGHKVTAACDGEEGLLLFEQEKPDLVITDIVMPKTEGLKAIRQMILLDNSTPIIAISGGGRHFNGQDLLPLAKMFGAKATLAKPFTKAELIQVVREVLS